LSKATLNIATAANAFLTGVIPTTVEEAMSEHNKNQ